MTVDRARDLAAIQAVELGHAMFWWRVTQAWCGNCLDCGREVYVSRFAVTGSALGVRCTGFRVSLNDSGAPSVP